MKGGFFVLRMLLQGVMDILWPPRTTCLLCGTPFPEIVIDELICSDCWATMLFPERVTCCRHCSRPVEGESNLCVECVGGTAFGRVFALGLHTGPLREATHHLKFGGRAELGALLGKRLADKLPTVWDCLVPVPLHRSRLAERGYNQATMIARGIQTQWAWPLIEGCLIRRRGTGHQAKLKKADRRQNLSGAFGVKGAPPWLGKSVLLVDDVLTTGITANTIAQVLYEHGAKSVDLAVLAVSTKTIRANSQNPVNE
jgi:ComF family protein